MDEHRILVTGGTGFVGSHIVQELRQRHPEYRLTILDLQPRSAWKQVVPGIEYIQTDVTDAVQVLNAIRQANPVLIVHTAGVVPTGSARYGRKARDIVFNINVTGTRNIIEAAKRCNVKSLVFTSSCTIITDDNDRDFPNMDERIPIPTSALIYGQSKVILSTLFYLQAVLLTIDRLPPKLLSWRQMGLNFELVHCDHPLSWGQETLI